MRVLRWGGVGVLGVMLAVGCSSSGDDVPVDAAAGANASVAGEAGAGGGAGRADVSESPAAGGRFPVSGGAPTLPDAGAGGACAGEYQCPAVEYFSSATITVDLPVSVADGQEAELTACRNTECHSGLGKAKQASDAAWAQDNHSGGDIDLVFDDAGAPASARLTWFFGDSALPSDRYSLTIRPMGAAAAITLFDAQVSYMTTAADPTLVSEGYCGHCSEVSRANVDARANH